MDASAAPPAASVEPHSAATTPQPAASDASYPQSNGAAGANLPSPVVSRVSTINTAAPIVQSSDATTSVVTPIPLARAPSTRTQPTAVATVVTGDDEEPTSVASPHNTATTLPRTYSIHPVGGGQVVSSAPQTATIVVAQPQAPAAAVPLAHAQAPPTSPSQQVVLYALPVDASSQVVAAPAISPSTRAVPSERPAAELDGVVPCERGYLFKKGEGGFLRSADFQLRYIVLANRAFAYFRDSKDAGSGVPPLKGWVPLEHLAVEVAGTMITLHPRDATSNRTWTFDTRDAGPEAALSWAAGFRLHGAIPFSVQIMEDRHQQMVRLNKTQPVSRRENTPATKPAPTPATIGASTVHVAETPIKQVVMGPSPMVTVASSGPAGTFTLVRPVQDGGALEAAAGEGIPDHAAIEKETRARRGEKCGIPAVAEMCRTTACCDAIICEPQTGCIMCLAATALAGGACFSCYCCCGKIQRGTACLQELTSLAGSRERIMRAEVEMRDGLFFPLCCYVACCCCFCCYAGTPLTERSQQHAKIVAAASAARSPAPAK